MARQGQAQRGTFILKTDSEPHCTFPGLNGGCDAFKNNMDKILVPKEMWVI